MNLNKTLKFLISIIIIFSLFFLFKDQLRNIAKKYLPVKIQNAIKIIIYDESFSKRLYNDYNTNFLPSTQLVELNYSSFKLDFVDSAEVGYFQKMVKKANKGWKSFYIESFDNNLLLTNSKGETFVKNTNVEFNTIKKIKNINLDNVHTVLDSLVVKDKFFISYIQKENECNIFNISVAKINQFEFEYKNFFSYDVCGEWIQGGRMQKFDFNNQDGLLFSLADNVVDKPNSNPQSDNSLYGKIIFKSFNGESEIIYSKGHRNPQGLLADDKVVLSTEHGPRGGDEINLIKFNNNYGWPLASYGSKYYNNNKKYFQDHESHGFEEPIFSFVPSIGISEIIKIPNNLFEEWNDNYLVSSLYRGSIYRIRFNKNFSKIIYIEEIFIGQRIRDLKIINNKIFLALETKGELGIIEKQLSE